VFAKAFDRIASRLDLLTACIQSLRSERDAAVKAAPAHRMFGDYVLTPVPNAFNGKTSWWISKKGCTVAHYCFSTSIPKEIGLQISDGLNGYI